MDRISRFFEWLNRKIDEWNGGYYGPILPDPRHETALEEDYEAYTPPRREEPLGKELLAARGVRFGTL